MITTTPEQAKANKRAARGAAYLDKRAPGWAQHIDTDKLSIKAGAAYSDEDGPACILCQLDRHFRPERFVALYSGGAAKVGLDASMRDNRSAVVQLGFNLMHGNNMGITSEMLDAAWTHEVSVRQEAALTDNAGSK